MYCTQQDLIDRFSERELIALTDFIDFSGAIEQTVLDKAILDAENEINGYLRLRYVLPLQYEPPELIAPACDITRYRLHRDGCPEEIATRYKLAVAYLRDLASGKALLPSDINGTAEIGSRVSLPKITAPQAFFTDELLGKM